MYTCALPAPQNAICPDATGSKLKDEISQLIMDCCGSKDWQSDEKRQIAMLNGIENFVRQYPSAEIRQAFNAACYPCPLYGTRRLPGLLPPKGGESLMREIKEYLTVAEREKAIRMIETVKRGPPQHSTLRDRLEQLSLDQKVEAVHKLNDALKRHSIESHNQPMAAKPLHDAVREVLKEIEHRAMLGSSPASEWPPWHARLALYKF